MIMGICASSQMLSKNVSINPTATAKIVHLDGRLQEFRQPIKAAHILSQNPNFFLCSSESMFINAHVPHVSHHEELQLGQLYFLMPLSQSQKPLSLQDLCALAIKASAALANSGAVLSSGETTSFRTPARAQACSKISMGFDSAGMKIH